MNVGPMAEDTWPCLKWLWIRIRALRAFSFPVSVIPVLVATAVVRPLVEWDWGVLVGSLVGVALLHAAGNLFNDYFDFRSGVDRKETGDEGRPGRLLVRGEMTPRSALFEAFVCLSLLTPVAAYLMQRCGPGLLWFGGLAVFAVYAYTGPPFQLKYKALGEPLIFLVFGPILMMGAAYAQTGRIELLALLFSVPVGLITTAILVGNNIRDQEEDGAAGIVTLVHVTGERRARLLYVTLVVASVLGLLLLSVVGLAPRVLGVSPLLLLILAGPLVNISRGKRIPDIDIRTARFETVVLLFVVTVLAVHGGTTLGQ